MKAPDATKQSITKDGPSDNVTAEPMAIQMINDDDLDQETYSIPPLNLAQATRRPIIKQGPSNSKLPGEAEQTPC